LDRPRQGDEGQAAREADHPSFLLPPPRAPFLLMKIRSVTCFVTVDESLAPEGLQHAGDLAKKAREVGAREGYDVQSARLAVQPLDRIIRGAPPVEFAFSFEQALRYAGFDYGALSAETERLFPHLTGIILGTESVFTSLRIASRSDGIDLQAVKAAAHVIHELAWSTEDGLGNFRFAAAANVQPGVPFFPVAYHDGSEPKFAFATEAADLAVGAFTQARNLDDARSQLVRLLEENGRRLKQVGEGLEEEFGLNFAGIDFSLAPYPEEGRSLATAIERLTGAKYGERGTLFGAAFVTDCLKRASYPRTGFGGLMLPMMEDWTMAARSREKLYSLDSLLLYSTVCGTGLDTVPLAGDTTEDAISALLLDLSALSVKLDKPLTARLIPVPGVRGGAMTHFSFEYFSNSRVFEIGPEKLSNKFREDKPVKFI
jgi:uncharacterized protein